MVASASQSVNFVFAKTPKREDGKRFEKNFFKGKRIDFKEKLSKRRFSYYMRGESRRYSECSISTWVACLTRLGPRRRTVFYLVIILVLVAILIYLVRNE